MNSFNFHELNPSAKPSGSADLMEQLLVRGFALCLLLPSQHGTCAVCLKVCDSRETRAGSHFLGYLTNYSQFAKYNSISLSLECSGSDSAKYADFQESYEICRNSGKFRWKCRRKIIDCCELSAKVRGNLPKFCELYRTIFK